MSAPPDSAPTPSTASGSMKRDRSESLSESGAGAAGPAKKLNTGAAAEDADKQAEIGDGVIPMDTSDSHTTPPTTGLSAPESAALPPMPPPAAAPAAAPARDPTQLTINMRCLIVTQDASIIIGKQGKHVNEIREKSNAKVNVSESIPGNPERILSVQGPLDAVSKAFGLVVRRINDEPFDQPSVPGSRAVTIKFIIPNSRMGSVIGKGGSKIKEIQEASGARLNASDAMLPGSTERILSVAGVADAVHIAVYYIGTILVEYQDRDRNPSSALSGQYCQGGAGGPTVGPGGGGERRSGGAASMPAAAPGASVQQFWIPNELVGSIIGKAGTKINEIRTQSQCQIRVTDPGTPAVPGGPVNPNERLVIIQGTPVNINTAVSLLHQRLEAEKIKKAQATGGI